MADAACAALESAGIRCWIAPRDIPPGDDWSAASIRAIDQSKVMVLIFSLNANESTEIPREVRRAANRNVRIVTVRIDRAEPAEALEYYLGTVQWFDALPPPVENHLQRLARDIRAILEPPAVKKGEPISKEGVGQQVRKERRQRRMSLRQLAFVISVTAAVLLMLVLGQIFVPSSLKLAVINHLVARIDRLAARGERYRRAAPVLTSDIHRAIQSEPRSPSSHPEAAAQSDELGGL